MNQAALAASALAALIPTMANLPSMWFAGQYANGSGNWETAIGAARYVLPADQ